MKKPLVLILLGVGGYFAYQHYQAGRNASPENITNPVWSEIRITYNKGATREIEMALFGEMLSDQDCRVLNPSRWAGITDCKECEIQPVRCHTELEPRYARLFNNVPIHSTYMTLDGRMRDARRGRVVIYGLSADEGDTFCESLRQQVAQQYKGVVGCVKARRD